jgi:hypothetical protein
VIGDVKVSLDFDEQRVLAALRGGTLAGLKLAGEHILQLSRQRVPIEEGTLERSGEVSDDGALTVAVSYDTPYAVRQHEDLTLRHAAGRTAKYLEIPMHEGADDAAKIVAATAQRKAGG